MGAVERPGLFTRLRATDAPGRHIVEISVGEGAMAITDDERRAHMATVVAG